MIGNTNARVNDALGINVNDPNTFVTSGVPNMQTMTNAIQTRIIVEEDAREALQEHETQLTQTVTANKTTADENDTKLRTTRVVAVPGTGWSETKPYSMTLTKDTEGCSALEGITNTDIPVISIHITSNQTDPADVKLQKKMFGMVDMIETIADGITLYCFNKKPTSGFNISIKGR